MTRIGTMSCRKAHRLAIRERFGALRSAPKLWKYGLSGDCHADLHHIKRDPGPAFYPLDGISGSGGSHPSVSGTLSCVYADLSVEEKAVCIPYFSIQ